MKKTTTTTKDAARRFWGDAQFKLSQRNEHDKNESEICMLSETFATNGSLMIYSDPAACDFVTVKNSRYETLDNMELIKKTITPYFDAGRAVMVPPSMFGHISAAYGKKIYIGACGNWMSFKAYDPDNGFSVTDGDRMGDFFNLGDFRVTFDAETVQKVFKRFKVEKVEICTPSRGCDFIKFTVAFKGSHFYVLLLKCFRDDWNADFEDEALELARKWEKEDDRAVKAA